MEVKRRTARYALLTVALAVIALVLGWMFGATLHAHPNADEKTQSLLQSWAIVSVALLGVTIIALVAIISRWIRKAIRLDEPLPPTPHYVDAWAEAGRRMKAPTQGSEIDIREEEDDAPSWRDDEDEPYGEGDDEEDSDDRG
jgi:hypothetical protein